MFTAPFFMYIIAFILFVFKTTWLLDKLKLDKDFLNEKLDVNIQPITIFAIATIIIGGIMFIDSLPLFCKQTFEFFQQKSQFRESPSSGWIIFHFVKMCIGYILMTNSKFVAGYIDDKSKKPNIN